MKLICAVLVTAVSLTTLVSVSEGRPVIVPVELYDVGRSLSEFEHSYDESDSGGFIWTTPKIKLPDVSVSKPSDLGQVIKVDVNPKGGGSGH